MLLFRGCANLCAALAALVFADVAHADVRVWPSFTGVGCTGTLQACIDASAAGDTVVIGADDPLFPDAYTAIDESLTIVRGITLRAGDGIDAVFAPGRGIRIVSSGADPFDATLERLQLRRARIYVDHGSSSAATYRLDRVRIRDAGDGDACAIDFNGSGSGDPHFIAGDGDLGFERPRTTSNAAICASHASGNWRVDVFRNRIVAARGALFAGISIGGPVGGNVVIDANQVRGIDLVRGITVSHGAGAASTIRVQNNAIAGQSIPGLGADEWAIRAAVANAAVFVVNNTTAYNARGVAVVAVGGGNSGRVANNLVALNTASGLLIDAAGVTNANNLAFGNGADFFTPGPGTVVADPLLGGRDDLRTRAGSPARGAGSNADAPTFPLGPTFDADGELRIVNGTVDIGAFEKNADYAVVERADASNTSGNVTAITSLAGLLGTNEALQLTPIASPGVASASLAANLGVYLESTAPVAWAMFAENLGALPLTRRYAVLAALDGRERYVHATTLANVVNAFTTLDHPDLNGRPFALAFVTHNWNPDGVGGTYHDHRLGLAYAGARWAIGNQDPTDMPAGLSFNVAIAPPGSPNAFVAGVGASSRATVPVSHRLLDGNPCAAPLVTRNNGASGASNDVAFALRYRRGGPGAAGGWQIETVGVGTPGFTAGTAFNVMVQGAQANACRDDRIFVDGFDGA